MKGSYRIVVQNAAVHFDFQIKRNITILKGNSATGKTTLVELVQEFYENGNSSGVQLHCEKICSVLSGRDWEPVLLAAKDRIIFIDEGNDFVRSEAFAKAIQNSDNYYVIVTREGLENLPYSVDEIYGIRQSGKYASFKQTYNELYHIYGNQKDDRDIRPEKVMIEDSNSGYEFLDGISSGKTWNVESAGGKSNIFQKLQKVQGNEKLLIIADGAAFGSEMDRVNKILLEKDNIVLYLPESFEWLILKSGVIAGKDIQNILAEPEQYIESSVYFSWERYFTTLLVEKAGNGYLKYNKKKINKAYLSPNISGRICNAMEEIHLI